MPQSHHKIRVIVLRNFFSMDTKLHFRQIMPPIVPFNVYSPLFLVLIVCMCWPECKWKLQHSQWSLTSFMLVYSSNRNVFWLYMLLDRSFVRLRLFLPLSLFVCVCERAKERIGIIFRGRTESRPKSPISTFIVAQDCIWHYHCVGFEHSVKATAPQGVLLK